MTTLDASVKEEVEWRARACRATPSYHHLLCAAEAMPETEVHGHCQKKKES